MSFFVLVEVGMQKSMRFGMVLSKPEKEIVIKLAEIEGGLSQAALIRRLIRRAATDRGLWLLEVNHKAITSPVQDGKDEKDNNFAQSDDAI